MVLFLLSYLGGVLTIVSPCILPVLPFVFARADRSFLRSGLPLLVGMAGTFAAVATLAAVGGGWAVDANQYGRLAALALLALFGITLLLPSLSERMTRPVVALGARLSEASRAGNEGRAPGVVSSLLLGVATGLLWAPCAGPILGLILTGAALRGPNVGTSLLLFAYAAGSATSLALALLIGGRVFAAMKRSLHAGEWVRRGLGVAVLAGVAAITLHLDTGFLTSLSLASTTSLEESLVSQLPPAPKPTETTPAPPAPSSTVAAGQSAVMSGGPAMMTKAAPAARAEALPVEGTLPSLSGATEWLNSGPLTAADLRGKVVLIDFWTYSCINCLRAIPYVRAWAERYRDQGLVVIGVHAPEFAFEKNVDNVKKAIADLKIDYPVAIDNGYAIWRAFNNEYWPAHYFIDAEGRIRHHHFGEGDYDGSERVIKQLLAEAGKTALPAGLVAVSASGAEAAPDFGDVRSPETYIGYERAEHFVSRGAVVQDAPKSYELGSLRLNEWGLSGNWTVGAERAVLSTGDGAIAFRFHARDLHLVLGPAEGDKPVRFQVTIDGAAPGDNHGADTDAEGEGTVAEHRLYQLIRQTGEVADHTFEIRFLDPGVQAYAFTFG
jgi:cytochrome c biogenesis protein CcdA/thiol-disulfide isomerase/thioredoxin